MRPRSPGLRARLVLALVATSALTLAVAAFALLAPLEQRLRNDEIETLVRQARAASSSIARLDPNELSPRSTETSRILKDLRRRSSADIALVDRSGRVLAGTDVEPGLISAPGGRAARQGRTVQVVADGELEVAIPVRTERGIYGLALRRTLEGVASAVAVVRRAMATAAVVGLAAALLLGAGLSSRLVRRLRGLRDAALGMAQSGPVVELAPDHAGDEIADLNRAFAVMQERLREQEQARRTFVATASHELRTPLTSLRLMLDLLHEELEGQPPDVEDIRRQVDQARKISDRLGALSAQLLDLSRLDAGVPLRSEPIDLSEQARAVVGEFAVRARETGREITLDGGHTVRATADPSAVAQVVRVLLDNALRFAPAGTPIEVTVRGDGDATTLRVGDRGPGVPPDEREQIFERFRRGSATGGEGGFGLGLAIARELARGMGGDLTVVDGDAGACFEVRLAPAPAL
jgi:signal transduction histidine kinase